MAGWKVKKTLNIVGRQVGKYRNQRDWSQEDLAGRLQRAGCSPIKIVFQSCVSFRFLQMVFLYYFSILYAIFGAKNS